ncbi:MAG: leucyl aminopeptidase family protein [Candidatus Pacebacteria bacterium]|nr:leucyl aminopeptidase family protein [Candidatus Paceibacterota bacterium]
MKITFKDNAKDIKGEVLFVSIDPKNKDEIVRDMPAGKAGNGVKTLYLKCEEKEKMNLRKLFLLVRKMVALAKSTKVEKIAFNFNDFKTCARQDLAQISDLELGEIIGTQLDFANYEFNEYKKPPKEGFNTIKEIIIFGTNKETQKAILKGNIIAEEVNKTRTLSNTPGGDMTPQILAQKAKEAVKNLPVKVTVLGEKEMEKQNMRAILSVGRGSDEESKFIIMEYKGGKKEEKPIVLVGKGVTFDAGGINLKPSSSLLGMNMDMSGGAAVIHTIALAAKMKLKKNVVGLTPSVENMTSGKSYRPGDVVRSMSGQTIEILNTDAEGRVILADALSYAGKYNGEVIIDVATLTGAAAVALGERASAIFSNNDALVKNLEEIAEKTGDYIWRLPMWEEYENEIKGSIGDLTNVHNKDSRYGGAIYGAIFLYQFVKNTKEEEKTPKWAHLDIAPRMTSTAGESLAAGALGTPVRLLYKFIEGYGSR